MAGIELVYISLHYCWSVQTNSGGGQSSWSAALYFSVDTGSAAPVIAGLSRHATLILDNHLYVAKIPFGMAQAALAQE